MYAVLDMDLPKSKKFHYPLNDGLKQLALASCLSGEWLNDTAINFFVAALRHSLEKKKNERFHVFETFFWNVLQSSQHDQEKMERVMRWASHPKLWEVRYWLIPMLTQGHWFLGVLQIPYDDEDDNIQSNSEFYLYILDSLYRQKLDKTYVPLQHFIVRSWSREHPGRTLPTGINLVIRQLKVPKQQNDFDCGMFLLVYMRKFTEQPITEHKPDWFNPNCIESLRTMLYAAIEEKSSQDIPSPSSSSSSSPSPSSP